MKTTRFVMIAALLTLPLCSLAIADPDPESSKDIRFDLNFPGGTAAEYVKTIIEQSGTKDIEYDACQLQVFEVPPINKKQIKISEAIKKLNRKSMLTISLQIMKQYSLQIITYDPKHMKHVRPIPTPVTFNCSNAFWAIQMETKKTILENPLEPFDVHFPGGSAADFLDLIKEISQVQNLVYDREDMADVIVPPMELRTVTLLAVLDALRRQPLETKDGSTQVYISYVENVDRGSMLSEYTTPVISVLVDKPNQSVEVFDFKPFARQGHRIEDVAGAIELSLEMADVGKTVEIKLHEPTQILMVRGTKTQLRYVTKVLKSLHVEPMTGMMQPNVPLKPAAPEKPKAPDKPTTSDAGSKTQSGTAMS